MISADKLSSNVEMLQWGNVAFEINCILEMHIFRAMLHNNLRYSGVGGAWGGNNWKWRCLGVLLGQHRRTHSLGLLGLQ